MSDSDHKVDVFISWSGPRSKAIADALYSWIPRVIQAVRPWKADDDISKGAKWPSELASKLQETSVGIVCVTPENRTEPWLLFEAGALSKLEESRVCTILYEIAPAALEPPLGLLNATALTRDDMLKLMKTINGMMESGALAEQVLLDTFDRWWGILEAELAKIPEPETTAPERQERDILEEILETVRRLDVEKFPTGAYLNLPYMPHTIAEMFGGPEPRVRVTGERTLPFSFRPSRKRDDDEGS